MSRNRVLCALGWLDEHLTAAAAACPELIPDVLHIEYRRMHIVAFALAHGANSESPDEMRSLLRESLRAVVCRAVGRVPQGIRRAIDHMPPSVLSIESYRHIVDLLEDRASAKVLAHSAEVSEEVIDMLHRLPQALHNPSLLLGMTNWWGREIVDGLQVIAARDGMQSLDDLARKLASAKRLERLPKRLVSLIENLPLPDASPPARVGSAVRLDRSEEIRDLAKRWRNCLANYVSHIGRGECAVYIVDADEPAACLVRRVGRLGWFVDDICGPRNSRVSRETTSALKESFAEHGILDYSRVATLMRFIDYNLYPDRIPF